MAYKCPKCGSLRISKISSPVTPKVIDELECDDCHHMWLTKQGEAKLEKALQEVADGKLTPFKEVFGKKKT